MLRWHPDHVGTYVFCVRRQPDGVGMFAVITIPVVCVVLLLGGGLDFTSSVCAWR